jgi:hypothetical protein
VSVRSGQQRFGTRSKPGGIALILLHPGFEHLVDRAAAPGRARIGVDRVERAKASIFLA